VSARELETPSSAANSLQTLNAQGSPPLQSGARTPDPILASLAVILVQENFAQILANIK
jgi:hypothetical protein